MVFDAKQPPVGVEDSKIAMALAIRCIQTLLDQLHVENTKWWTLTILISVLFFTSDASARAEESRISHDIYTAVVNLTYKDAGGVLKTEKNDIGRYGQNSRIEKEWGWVVHVRTADNQTHGCTPPTNVPKERWIALVSRGNCKFTKKILNAAVLRNASAVVIYNHEEDDELLTMDHKGEKGEHSECCGGGKTSNRAVRELAKYTLCVEICTISLFFDILLSKLSVQISTKSEKLKSIKARAPLLCRKVDGCFQASTKFNVNDGSETASWSKRI